MTTVDRSGTTVPSSHPAIVKGGLIVKSDTASTISAARTLTTDDSGGVFLVAKTSAYAITLPAPQQGLKFTFMVADTGAFNVTITAPSTYLYGTLTIAADAAIAATGTTLTLVTAGSIGDNVTIVGIDATHYLVTGVCIAAADLSIA